MDPVTIGLSLAAQFAPSLIKYFTGSEKASNVAEQVIGAAQIVTGVQNPEQAMEMLKANAQMAAQFQQKLLDSEVELQKAQLLDVQSARHMQEVALQQDDLFSKRFVYVFAAAWSLFSMAYATLVTFWTPATPEGKGIAQTVLGFLLGTAVASIFNYLYGSTKNSMDKTKLLAQSQLSK